MFAPGKNQLRKKLKGGRHGCKAPSTETKWGLSSMGEGLICLSVWEKITLCDEPLMHGYNPCFIEGD
jgi:hypothetical protein